MITSLSELYFRFRRFIILVQTKKSAFYELRQQHTLREKFQYSESFWSTFSRIQTEYGEIPRISLYSVRMWENADQNNSKYRNFSRSDKQLKTMGKSEA